MSNWIPVLPVADLPAGGSRSATVDGRQVAVFHTSDGEWFAVDNQCPHEGYPLVQGYVRECVLTCAWHNFKFDIRDGSCLKGDEDLPTWELRLEAGMVEVRDKPQRFDQQKAFESLRQGVLDHNSIRAAREVQRLLRAGVKPNEIALRTACWDAAHGEFGCGHGLAVAADAAELIDRRPEIDPLLPLVQALDITGDTIVRRPPRPTPMPIPIEVGDDRALDQRRRDLLEAIEDEATERAEALWLGALGSVTATTAEAWLHEAISMHFLGFGHPLIYTTKAFSLIDRVGWEAGRTMLPGLLFRAATSTREDTLPPMAKVRSAVAELDLEELWQKNSAGGEFEPDEELVRIILEAKGREASAAILQALDAGRGWRTLIASIVEAAAERLLRFDHAYDADPTVQEGWLDVTHGMTYAIAVAEALERVPAPFQLRHLLWATHFVNRTKALDVATGTDPAGEHVESGSSIPDSDGLEDLALGDSLVRPIVVAHAIKTAVAAGAWFRRAGRALPLRAAERLLHSPVRERNIGRAVHEARRFVIDGKPPRTLT